MGSPVRVLHVVVNMNRGGAETLIMNLYRNIDKSKVQFDFLTSKSGVFDEEIKEMGGRVFRVPYISDTGLFQYKKSIELFFKQHNRYRIVHSHLDKMSGMVLRAAEKAGIPIRIAHSHNTKSEGGMAARLFKWYAGRMIHSSATHHYACSAAAAAWLFRKQARQAVILKNSIETERFSFSPSVGRQMKQNLNIDNQTTVLGHVGRFCLQKNHMFLLEMYAALVKKQPNTVLLLVGDGPLRPKIEMKIKELNLEEKVRVLGIREDIPDLLQAMDVFIFPSIHEGLPVTLIEAQSSGLPCIVSDKVSAEADLGNGLVHFVSLEKMDTWITAITAALRNTPIRKSSNQLIREKGYDIRQTVEIAQLTYLDMGRKAT